jgi:predicted  nucleic acid-binding Zn-ribbon protein
VNHICPKCGSDNVEVGNVVLGCLACGWSYLNEHPCRVCGAPATGAMGGNGKPLYSCSAHPFTSDDVRRAFAGFAAAVKGG